jgi:hypothetical protein
MIVDTFEPPRELEILPIHQESKAVSAVETNHKDTKDTKGGIALTVSPFVSLCLM